MRTLPLCLMFCPLVAAHEEEIGALVQRLGAEDYRDRERATQELEDHVRHHGQEAFDALEACLGQDMALEARHRVLSLVDRLGCVRLLWQRSFEPCPLSRPGLTASASVVVVRSERGLVALDARSGEVLWNKVGCYYKDAPGILGDTVFAHLPPDSIAAYHARSGKLLWSHRLEDVGGDSGRRRRVHLSDGSFEMRDIPAAEQTDALLDTRLVPELRRLLVTTPWRYCMSVSLDGERLWVANFGPDKRPRTTPPCVAPELGLVFAGGGTGHLFALRMADGTIAWRVPVPGLSHVGPGRTDARVFVTARPRLGDRYEGHLHCFEASTGERRWTFRPDVSAASRDRPTETVETDRGSVRRGFISHPGDETWLRGTDLVANGTVLITEDQALRYGLRAEDGEVLWRHAVDDTWISGVEKDGRVYGGSNDGELLAFDPGTGKVLRRIDLTRLRPADEVPKIEVTRGNQPPRGELGGVSSPCFVGDTCYLATASGWVVALGVPPFISSRR